MLKPYYQDEYATIYCGDSLDVLPQLDPVDLCFTSPPYKELRAYGGQDASPVDDVLECVRLTDKGQMFVNYGLLHHKGEVDLYWMKTVERMRGRGLRFFSMYVWDKLSGLCGDWNGRFAPSAELVFHFNLRGIRPQKIVKTKGGRACRTFRHKDGSTRPASRSGDVLPWKIYDNVIRVSPCRSSKERTGHPAQFPIALPEVFIKSWPGTVLDPFSGSGTTCVAAKKNGQRSIGVEINEPYCEMAADRLRVGEFDGKAAS